MWGVPGGNSKAPARGYRAGALCCVLAGYLLSACACANS